MPKRRYIAAMTLGVLLTATAMMFIAPTQLLGQDPSRGRLDTPESPSGPLGLEDLPPDARDLPRPVEPERNPESSPLSPAPQQERSPASVVQQVPSDAPRLESEADLSNYIEAQHRLLAEQSAVDPELFIAAGVTFMRPLSDDELAESIPLGPGSSLGNVEWHGPDNLTGWGGARWVLPLSETAASLHDSGVLPSGDSLLGVTYVEVRGPIAEIIQLVGRPSVLIVDPGDLREFAALREQNPGGVLAPRLPGSLYGELGSLNDDR